VEMFEESIEPREGDDLPGYWGLLAEELHEPAPPIESEAAEPHNRLVSLAPRRDRPARRRRREAAQQQEHLAFNRNAFRLLLAVLVGVAIGGLIRVAGVAGPPTQVGDAGAVQGDRATKNTPTAAASQDGPKLAISQASLSPVPLLEQFGMAPACFHDPRQQPPFELPPPADGSEADPDPAHTLDAAHCCTHCHTAGQQNDASQPVVRNIVSSCTLCHVKL